MRCECEHPLDPVARRLWSCRQCGGGVSAAADRCRGLADLYRAVFQPYRLRRLDRARVRSRDDHRTGAGDRGARRARPLRRRAVRLYGLGRDRRRDPRRRPAGEGRKPFGTLLLRSGDRRYRARDLCAAGHSGVHARACAADGGYRDAEPIRAGASCRTHQRDVTRRAWRNRCASRLGTADDSGDVAAHRRDAGRCDRSSGFRCFGALPGAYAEAADRGQWRGRCHCGFVFCAHSALRFCGGSCLARPRRYSVCCAGPPRPERARSC
jgi:hypothetical protein